MKPKLSVVVPVYNVESYLAAAIDSVINQTLDFENSTELILVNDGSTDNSGEICLEYQAKYPGNILYIEQSNQGVSAARNTCLKHARGQYITFFDADDIWSRDAFRQAINFLEKHPKRVDVVAVKIKFFDGSIDEHPTNYKFKTTRVIDLNKDPDNPLLHLNSCVLRKEVLKRWKFNKELTIAEDARMLNEILLEKKAYGVLKDPVYHYRKRQNGMSAIGGQFKNPDFYSATPKLFYLYLLDLWRGQNGRPHKFMQYLVLSDLVWRLQQSSQSTLSEKQEEDYKKLIERIVKQLDDEAIVASRNMPLSQKIFILKMKHGKKYEEKLEFREDAYYFDNNYLDRPYESANLAFDFLNDLGGGEYKIEGYEPEGKISEKDHYIIETSVGRFSLKNTIREQRKKSFLGADIYDGGGFEVGISLNKNDTVTAKFITKTGHEYVVPIQTNLFTRLSSLSNSYRVDKERIFKKKKGGLRSYPNKLYRRFLFEAVYQLSIVCNWKLKQSFELWRRVKTRNFALLPLKRKLFEVAKPLLLIGEAVFMIPRSLLLRNLYFIFRPLIKRPLWLVSDRGMAAGDNGEVFYRYAESLRGNTANIYFVISKKSTDYKRMKQYGKVLDQRSLRYKLFLLVADKIISSHADTETTNPFFRQSDHFADLMDFEFVFLQHGVIRNDLSSWLNRFDKNISLFVTSAEKERQSILEHPYYYSEKSLVLTGLPRYDLLENQPQGKLILMPTYRASMTKNLRADKSGARKYNPAFKGTEYFEFYNNLMNDERILNALKRHKMTGEFYLHPALVANIGDFKSSKYFVVKNYPYDYTKAFREGSLLVSDYSSVTFDFAYLKKPVIYTRFDEDSFYDNQTYTKAEFFIEERDGFGPTAYDYESLVKEIIKTVQSGCIMEKKYQTRVDSFFAHVDKNNSERVYAAITQHNS